MVLENEFSKMQSRSKPPDCIFLSYGTRSKLNSIFAMDLGGSININGQNIRVIYDNSVRDDEIYLSPRSSLLTTYVERNRRNFLGIWNDEEDLKQAKVQPLFSLYARIRNPRSITKIVLT